MDCFKCASFSETGKLERYRGDCEACGEPMLVSSARDFRFGVCSNRCYQRDYRKRRRGRNSVVDWKGRRMNECCAVCKTPLDQWGKENKRKDAVYCSAKCRQWAYRRRRL